MQGSLGPWLPQLLFWKTVLGHRVTPWTLLPGSAGPQFQMQRWRFILMGWRLDLPSQILLGNGHLPLNNHGEMVRIRWLPRLRTSMAIVAQGATR